MNDQPNVHYHPNSLCESDEVGAGTRIWAFAHVLPGARIGVDCNVCDGVFIEGDVVVGDRVTIKSGVQLWNGARIADDVFIGPNATFTNDKNPRSRQWQDAVTQTFVEEGASIGANATILPGITIGRRAMVGAGAVVTHSVPPNALVVGNPARIVDYVDSVEVRLDESAKAERSGLEVAGVQIIELSHAEDLRGDLTAAELDTLLPFQVARYFTVFNVPSSRVRGEHAHRACHQFMTCVAGAVTVAVDDGQHRATIRLDRPDVGVHVPPMVWATQFEYSSDAVLLVFASHPYDPGDYIRDYREFAALVAPDGRNAGIQLDQH